VVIAGTFDTKGAELRHIRDILQAEGLRTRTVDLSTSGRVSGVEVPPLEVALHHRRGAAAVFSADRGEAVAAMAEAFRHWIGRQAGVAGIISAGGSGGTALATQGMRRLPIGVPKVMVSTVASGDTAAYVGPNDIAMMYSVADIAGLNAITRRVIGNAAHAVAGMAKWAVPAGAGGKPGVGMTMFGVTTACCTTVREALEAEYEVYTFHATGAGGQSMEKLAESGLVRGMIDVTTTEVPDFLVGGVFPCTEDRFGAVARTRLPYVGSVGACDMANFGAKETVPERFRGRNLYVHNPQVTLMRTTPEENAAIGRFVVERLNRMEGPVRFFLPEGGVSALDAPGQPFWDPAADAALFTALERSVRQTSNRQLIRIRHHINEPEFASAIVNALRPLAGRPGTRRKVAR
jgi:uncharacterized protein (UPF0261 family)